MAQTAGFKAAGTEPDWDQRLGQRLKLRDLHVLTVVARWGSMAKAAAHLSTSQSVVSEAIASLESALGVRLLDRTPRGVELTVYADALLKRGHVVFDELREGIKDIKALAGATAGEVRIACAEFLAAGLIMDTVDAFTRRYADTVCHVSEADVTSLDFHQLHRRDVDLMVTRVPNGFADDDLAIEPLFDDPHLVVAGAKSPWAGRRNLTLADLADAPWIVPPAPIVHAILAEAFEAQGLKMPLRHAAAGIDAALQRAAMGAARPAGEAERQAAANRHRQPQEPHCEPGGAAVHRAAARGGQGLRPRAKLI